MIGLVSEIVGCLLAAAAIGGAVGWLLRQVSVVKLNQHIYDVTTALQIKDQTLHSTQLELKAKASTILIYESKLAAAEALANSQQEDLAAQAQRLRAVQDQLDAATQKVSALESEQQAASQRYQASDATIAAFEQEARQANAARTAAQQALMDKEEELEELRNRLVETETNLAKLERLRVQLTDIEPAQGRVHWLEVQLSEKDVQHRAALHEIEEAKAALARRIAELEALAQQVQDQEAVLHDWEAKYNKALKQHAAETNLVETQRGVIQDLQTTLTERDRTLLKQEEQIAALQRQLTELQLLHEALAERTTAAPTPGEKEGVRPRKQPVEVRSARRAQGDDTLVTARANSRDADQLILQIGQAKPAGEPEKDDLTKIRGIGPALQQALNKMGTYTYVQIAKWTPGDIARVAKQLSTPLDRIKKNNWIASAKKQHREKYGERL